MLEWYSAALSIAFCVCVVVIYRQTFLPILTSIERPAWKLSIGAQYGSTDDCSPLTIWLNATGFRTKILHSAHSISSLTPLEFFFEFATAYYVAFMVVWLSKCDLFVMKWYKYVLVWWRIVWLITITLFFLKYYSCGSWHKSKWINSMGLLFTHSFLLFA